MSTWSDNLKVLATGTEETLIRPCVDCGVTTGRYCDGPKGETGPPCYAAVRVPNEKWEKGQMTPFCGPCEKKQKERHGKLGMCHFCRGMLWCVPP